MVITGDINCLQHHAVKLVVEVPVPSSLFDFSALIGINKIPTQDGFYLAVAEEFEQDKAIVTVGQMNELADEDFSLSINHKPKDG